MRNLPQQGHQQERRVLLEPNERGVVVHGLHAALYLPQETRLELSRRREQLRRRVTLRRTETSSYHVITSAGGGGAALRTSPLYTSTLRSRSHSTERSLVT